MMMKRVIIILLALLMLGGLFAACGGEKDEETQPALTLPNIDAPASIVQNNGPRTENETGDGGVIDDGKEPFPAGQTEDPNNAPSTTISTEFVGSDTEAPQPWPDSDTPAPTYPRPSDPGTTEVVPSYDDSDEDLPAVTTEYPDDTDEDLG